MFDGYIVLYAGCQNLSFSLHLCWEYVIIVFSIESVSEGLYEKNAHGSKVMLLVLTAECAIGWRSVEIRVS